MATPRSKPWVRPVVGALIVAVTSFGLGYPLWWNHRVATGGAALLRKSAVAAVNPSSPARVCSNSTLADSAPEGTSPGVLEIPSIGLVAPVLQGVTDNVLNIAVGHQPTTPWPGAPGESMVLAHDVSYFAGLSKVRSGAQVIWLTGCLKASFVVDKETVLAPGDLVYPGTVSSGLALVTCYPTNALFWTTQRFVVTTHLVSVVLAKQSLPNQKAAALPVMTVNAPAVLVNEGLDLAKNSLQLGTLSLAGTPTANFAQSPAALSIERDALEVFFGAKKSVEQQKTSWWNDLAVSGLVLPKTWPSFGRVNIAIELHGATPMSVSIASASATATVVLHDNTWQLAALGGS